MYWSNSIVLLHISCNNVTLCYGFWILFFQTYLEGSVHFGAFVSTTVTYCTLLLKYKNLSFLTQKCFLYSSQFSQLIWGNEPPLGLQAAMSYKKRHVCSRLIWHTRMIGRLGIQGKHTHTRCICVVLSFFSFLLSMSSMHNLWNTELFSCIHFCFIARHVLITAFY